MVIHDPYVGALRHSSQAFPAGVFMDSDALTDHVLRLGLARSTNLFAYESLVRAVNTAAPQLRRVRLHLRGALRHDAPCQGLFKEWATSLARQWAAIGLQFSIVLDDHLHVRKSILQSTLGFLELRCEWGLSPYIDTWANLKVAAPCRRVKHTKVQRVKESNF